MKIPAESINQEDTVVSRDIAPTTGMGSWFRSSDDIVNPASFIAKGTRSKAYPMKMMGG